MNKKPCPLCNQGYLTDKVVYELINDELTPLYYSECDYCSSEQADEFQVRANLDAVKNNRTKIMFYPETRQFKEVIRQIKDLTYYAGKDKNGLAIYEPNQPLPVLCFTGTVKIHGTNAGIRISDDGVQALSRTRIITPEDDNYGFASWVRDNENWFKELHTPGNETIIYGEWAGEGIQKGVAVSQLPKSFYIFHVSDECVIPQLRQNILKNMYFIDSFGVLYIAIDFNVPEQFVDQMVAWVNDVEKQCPVGRALGVDGVGEGIVFVSSYKGHRIVFKVKGEKHAVTKVKTLVPVDPVKLESIEAFVEAVVTENRLQQMFDLMPNTDMKNIGAFFKSVCQDVFKEESDTLEASGLIQKDVNKTIVEKAKKFYISHANNH